MLIKSQISHKNGLDRLNITEFLNGKLIYYLGIIYLDNNVLLNRNGKGNKKKIKILLKD